MAERLPSAAGRPLVADGGGSNRHDSSAGRGRFRLESKPEHFDAAFVAQLRNAGIGEFHVWTVDDPTTAKYYAELGLGESPPIDRP